MFNLNYVLIGGAVAVIAIGQIIFKHAARSIVTAEGMGVAEFARSNLYPALLILVAATLYLCSTLAWVQALRTVPLSVAFTFNSLAFIFVPAAGFLIFHEPVPRYFLPGLVLIVAGILLVSRG